MSFQPFDRNPSGIVFFGTNATDQVFESNSNFTIDGTSLVATNVKISDGGNIGSASDADAITIAANGNVTITQDLSITGDLTVNGDTTTINTTNLTVEDSLIELNRGAASNSNDCGILIERGSTGNNAIFAWDESADKFVVGTTTATADATGNLSITSATIVADTFEGKVSADAITGQTEKSGAAASNDLLLIIDSEDSNAIKKITRGNLISGLGGFSNFTVTADSGSNQTIADGNTLDIAGGDGITTAVGATDTVTVTADLKANGGLVFETNEIAVDLGASSITGTLAVGDGGTGATSASGARTALGLAIGSDVQAYDAGLASIAGLTTAANKLIYTTASDTYAVADLSAFGRSLIDDADAATARTTLGVDAAGTDNSTDVTLETSSHDYLSLSGQEITLGAIVLSTDVSGQLPVANGGTGASAASGARTNLGLAIGSDVQAYHANLAAIAGMTPSDGYFIVGNGSTFVLENGATARASLGVDAAGTDNSTDVTIASGRDYLTISGQEITCGVVDISDDTNLAAGTGLTLSGDTVSISNGGVDTTQLAAGAVTEAKRERTVATANSTSTISNDITLATGGSGGITLTLPAAASGKMVTVKKVDSGAGTITLDPPGSVTIDGALTKVLYHQYETMTCVSDGTNWFIV